MYNKKIIRLTESEFKTIIKESISTILENINDKKLLKESEIINVDLYDIDTSDYPELDEYLQDANIPDSISVEMMFDENESDNGDYYTPSTSAYFSLYDYNIDINGEFKKYLPEELYDSFINCVSELIERNKSAYEEEALENHNLSFSDYGDYFYDSRNDS